MNETFGFSIRKDARQKGLRMAAQIAALSGVLAAAAAASQAAEAKPGGNKAPELDANSAQSSASAASQLGNLFRTSARGGCGCAPCWGPPAPPAMDPELFMLFEGEVAA